MSLMDLSREILSLAKALNPFTEYSSAFCRSSSAERKTAAPPSPGPYIKQCKHQMLNRTCFEFLS